MAFLAINSDNHSHYSHALTSMIIKACVMKFVSDQFFFSETFLSLCQILLHTQFHNFSYSYLLYFEEEIAEEFEFNETIKMVFVF